MANSQRLMRFVLILAGIALLLHLVDQVWVFGQRLGSMVSILAGAWYISVLARPLIGLLSKIRLPRAVIERYRSKVSLNTVRKLEYWRLPYGIPVAISYITLLVAIVGIVSIGATTIIPQVSDLVIRAPDIFQTLPNQISDITDNIARTWNLDLQVVNEFLRSQDISGQLRQVTPTIGQQLINILTGAGSFLTQILLSIILSIYITMEGSKLRRDIFAILPQGAHETVRAAIFQITRAFEGYLRGALLAAGIEGTMCFITLSLFGVNFALATATVYFVLNLVPLVGSPLGITIAVLVTLFANPSVVWWVLLALICSNLLNAYVITPRVMRDSVGLPSILALLSTSVGVQLFGFWGLIFGTPVTGAIYAFIYKFLVPRAQGKTNFENRAGEAVAGTP
jgi:predicted PurR-regulated permease PerM